VYRFASVAAVCLFFAPSLCAAAAEVPSAKEILDRYAETRNKLKSYIIKQHEVYASSGTQGKCRDEALIEFRYDGKRYCRQRDSWGDYGGMRGRVSKDKPQRQTILYDGEKIYIYTQPGNGAGKGFIGVIAEPDKMLIEKNGYNSDPLYGEFCSERQYIDTFFLAAGNKVSVRAKTERIGDSECYVVDAKTTRGKYTVWFDPNHGYNIAKAEVSKSGKDILITQPVDETPFGKGNPVRFASERESVKDVRFKKIGDLWVPWEGTIKSDFRLSDGSKNSCTHRIECTELIVNPDHEALGSFVPKFANGTMVRVLGVARTRFTWKDGKYVDPQPMGRPGGMDK
jgi:hypothetical protein